MPLEQQIMPKLKINIPVAFASGVSVLLVALLLVADSFQPGPEMPAAKPGAGMVDIPEGPNRIVGSWLDQQYTPCAEQAWPYIQPKCLSAASPKERAAPAPKAAHQTVRAVPTTDGVALASEQSASPQPAVKSEETTNAAARIMPRTQAVEARPSRKAKGVRNARERTAKPRTAERIVRRWREIEYEAADGNDARQRESYFEIGR